MFLRDGVIAVVLSVLSMKYAPGFERTVFDVNAAGGRPPEHALLFETQFYF